MRLLLLFVVAAQPSSFPLSKKSHMTSPPSCAETSNYFTFRSRNFSSYFQHLPFNLGLALSTGALHKPTVLYSIYIKTVTNRASSKVQMPPSEMPPTLVSGESNVLNPMSAAELGHVSCLLYLSFSRLLCFLFVRFIQAQPVVIVVNDPTTQPGYDGSSNYASLVHWGLNDGHGSGVPVIIYYVTGTTQAELDAQSFREEYLLRTQAAIEWKKDKKINAERDAKEKLAADHNREKNEKDLQEKVWAEVGATTEAELKSTCNHSDFWGQERTKKKSKCESCGQKRSIVVFKCPHCIMTVCPICMNKLRSERMSA